MLYEVITAVGDDVDVVDHLERFADVVGHHDRGRAERVVQLADQRRNDVERPLVLLRERGCPAGVLSARITSYNVCYTKLLRGNVSHCRDLLGKLGIRRIAHDPLTLPDLDLPPVFRPAAGRFH